MCYPPRNQCCVEHYQYRSCAATQRAARQDPCSPSDTGVNEHRPKSHRGPVGGTCATYDMTSHRVPYLSCWTPCRRSRSRSIGWRRFIGGIALGAPRIRAINTLSKGIYSAYSPRSQGDAPDEPPRCPDGERIHRRTARLTYMDGFGAVRNSAESNVSNLISAIRTW